MSKCHSSQEEAGWSSWESALLQVQSWNSRRKQGLHQQMIRWQRAYCSRDMIFLYILWINLPPFFQRFSTDMIEQYKQLHHLHISLLLIPGVIVLDVYDVCISNHIYRTSIQEALILYVKSQCRQVAAYMEIAPAPAISVRWPRACRVSGWEFRFCILSQTHGSERECNNQQSRLIKVCLKVHIGKNNHVSWWLISSALLVKAMWNYLGWLPMFEMGSSQLPSRIKVLHNRRELQFGFRKYFFKVIITCKGSQRHLAQVLRSGDGISPRHMIAWIIIQCKDNGLLVPTITSHHKPLLTSGNQPSFHHHWPS